jgi:ketosteroid isomerase-like protein
MDAEELARAYYEAIDENEYDRLRELLAADFTQERSERTFESATAFVQFMRGERPDRDTSHEIHQVTADGKRVVAEGTLRRANGDTLFRFADVFTVQGGRFASLRTYTI